LPRAAIVAARVPASAGCATAAYHGTEINAALSAPAAAAMAE
jgi:hypothetical protein